MCACASMRTPALTFSISFVQNPVIPPVVYPNPVYVSGFSGRRGGLVWAVQGWGEGESAAYKIKSSALVN